MLKVQNINCTITEVHMTNYYYTQKYGPKLWWNYFLVFFLTSVLFYLFVVHCRVEIIVFRFGHHILKETLAYWKSPESTWTCATDLRVEGTRSASSGERKLRGGMVGLSKHLKVFHADRKQNCGHRWKLQEDDIHFRADFLTMRCSTLQ